MPNQIANFLNLSEPELYTGHSFRRTSATLLVDAGADITTLKRHGGSKSSTITEGYIEHSITNKRKIGEQITSSISLNPSSTSTGKSKSSTPAMKRLKMTEEGHVQAEAQPSTSKAYDSVGVEKQNENSSFHFNNCSMTIQIFGNKQVD